MTSKKLLIVGVALVLACTETTIAIPNPEECRTVGGTDADAPDIAHSYSRDGGASRSGGGVAGAINLQGTSGDSTGGLVVIPYDQCLQHLIDDISSGGAVLTYNEYGAGIDGAVFASGGSFNPYGDSRLGGTENCWGGNFTAHHGSDTVISTADDIQGGNIRVFITADWFDNAGEIIYQETGQDVRDPCGDNSIDDDSNDSLDDFFAVSDPCGFGVHVLNNTVIGTASGQLGIGNCTVNAYKINTTNPNGPAPRGATLSDNMGLDGGVWMFIGISTGNLSASVSGSAFTVVDPYHCEGVVLLALYRCSGTYSNFVDGQYYNCYGTWYSPGGTSPSPYGSRPGIVLTETCTEWPPRH